MIGRNIPLIPSGVPCLSPRNVQNGSNEVMLFFFLLLSFMWIFSCINYVAALFLVEAWDDGGFVMKDPIRTGCSHSLTVIGFFCILWGVQTLFSSCEYGEKRYNTMSSLNSSTNWCVPTNNSLFCLCRQILVRYFIGLHLLVWSPLGLSL